MERSQPLVGMDGKIAPRVLAHRFPYFFSHELPFQTHEIADSAIPWCHFKMPVVICEILSPKRIRQQIVF
jgi:hypothetical protein